MTSSIRWTSQDLQSLPDDGKRYEIIGGELYMSKQPHWNHQKVAFRLANFLEAWNLETQAGEVGFTPGLVFAEDDDVAPDVVWISKERLVIALEDDGKLHNAPELVIEVLSPGSTNQNRDYEVKRKLYSRRGVKEYWIVSWQKRQIDVYRRDDNTQELRSGISLHEGDTLTSPLLEGFGRTISEIFKGVNAI